MPQDFSFNSRFKRFEQSFADGNVFIVCQYRDGLWRSLVGNRVHWMDETKEIGAYKTLPEAKLAGMEATRAIAYRILEEANEYWYNKYLLWQCVGVAIALYISAYFLLPDIWNL